MSAESHATRKGTGMVPRWFLNILHEIIYADGQDGYLAVQAISVAMDARSLSVPDVLAGWANGLGQTGIGNALGISRHCVCRRMKTLRRRLGAPLLRNLHGNRTAANVLSAFDFGHGRTMPNILHVIRRLASLSPVELCVLSALLRLMTEDETLALLGISHTWYHTIKARLSASFLIVPPGRRRKVKISACTQNPNLLPYAAFAERCAF